MMYNGIDVSRAEYYMGILAFAGTGPAHFVRPARWQYGVPVCSTVSGSSYMRLVRNIAGAEAA